MRKPKIGIVGKGFVGSAVLHGFSPAVGCDSETRVFDKDPMKIQKVNLVPVFKSLSRRFHPHTAFDRMLNYKKHRTQDVTVKAENFNDKPYVHARHFSFGCSHLVPLCVVDGALVLED